MQRVVPDKIDLASLTGAVGAASFASGFQYLRQQAVVSLSWDSSQGALRGAVHEGTLVYAATAHFSRSAGSPLQFVAGECSCPSQSRCQHVAALVLAATEAGAVQAEPPPGPPRPGPASASWEQSLDALLESRPGGAVGQPGEAPLAIELTLGENARPLPSVRRAAGSLAAAGPPVKLAARLVQPGKNGGWVTGSLVWTRLDSLRFSGHPAAQVRLLQEFYAAYRSRDSRPVFRPNGEERSIDLAAFESRQLWPLLDEAASVGLRLVRAGQLGAVEPYGCAELCLDASSSEPSGALVITPVIRIDGTDADAEVIRLIGAEGHGLVYVDRAEAQRSADRSGWRFRLARLTRVAPPQLQRMALENQRLEVPAAEQSRFADEYYPRLRQLATVVSSDGSFTPPVISDPTLVLRASYGPGHDAEVGWEWAYQIGDARLRTPLDPPPEAGYRDLAAEQIVLAGLEELPLSRFGLIRHDLRPSGQLPPGPRRDLALAPRVRLGGLDTMRFTTELLPLLAGQPGVDIEVAGDRADYREAGESLRIGVSTDEQPADPDWFDLGITITVEGQPVPFADVFVALSRGQPYLLLANGAYFSLQKPELQALARLIEEARALQDAPGDQLRISRFQAGLWDELAELGVVSHQASAWQQQVQGLLSVDAIECAEPPAAVQATLRPYQRSGFQWLAFLWEHQLGGILADDMGLGKTLQSLALICHAKQAAPASPPFLILAPTSVVSNWRSESARFTPGLNVVTISGTAARRRRALSEVIAGADVVVTSYTLLRIDFDAYAEMAWSGLILDEAQFVKNHQSKIYQCARRLPAPFKVAITGTPMENNLMELWSLLSITAPGLFPNPTRFRDYYARPVEKHGQAELLAQLRRRIKPLVRRRTKEQVAGDLPAKQQQVLEVDLHPRHRKLYETHLQRERQKVLHLINDLDSNRFTILRSLTLLRQLSLHAGLVDDAHWDMPCRKIDALLEQLLDVTGGGHRALVFSQFTRFLGIVRERLDMAGIQHCYLDGKTRDRDAVLRSFKDGPAPVFLISLKAGGFGLNLTEADYCFLLDPWWNPATEAQAVDRTHRIGQTRQVMVYRLIAAGTIEEKVMALKARKAELFSSVIDGGNVFGATLGAGDIRELLT
jgi:superfamily II DNA or RNA helicase